MALSEREQRILKEIAQDLAAAEPRLEHALISARFPVLRRRLIVMPGDLQRRRRAWIAGVWASLLAGIALLAIGLGLHMVILLWLGAPLAQFGPAACGYLCRKTHRSRRRKAVMAVPGGAE